MSTGPPQPDGTSPVGPGQLTALLQALAAAPEDHGWDQEPQPGEQVDRFRILRRIGEGGFGVVFEARDEVLGRLVAIKLVRAARRSAPGSERVFMEAEAAARLSHPNIVTLHDVGRCPRGPYLVLELLRGESLAQRLARGPVPLVESVRIAGEVARALAHAHRHAVIHRDLKPGNVFLCEDGQVKVLDFGLAHAFGRPRADGGTPAFMAPEQRRGAPEDERSDVHALGVTLHQMLTGELPFGSDGLQHPRLPASRLDIPESPELAELVHRMLARDPVRRPRDGAEAAEALARVASALQPASPGRSRPVRRRRRWPLALAMAAVAAAVSMGTVALRRALPGKAGAPARLQLAVSDVVNETGEKELELSGLLRTVLEQSTFLEVLPRGRLVDALSRPPGEGPVRLDEAASQAAARAVRARYLLLARLFRLGETYLLEVRAIDPSSGESAFAFKEQVLGKNGLAGLVDGVAERARLLLGEDPAAIRRSTIPANLVTGSLEAWSAYAGGLACAEQRSFVGSFGPCLADMERAVAIDPGFALAHLQISVLRFLEGAPRALQRLALRQAEAQADRVPPHDRLRLQGWAAFLAGRELEAKAILRQAAEASPDDKFAWWLAGEIPHHRDEYAESLPFFRRVHALAPGWFDATQHLAFALGATGDVGGLGRLLAEQGAPGQGAGALTAACYAQLWTDPAGAVATCQRAQAAGGVEETPGFLAIALLHAGRRAELGAHLAAMRKQEDAARRSRDDPRGFAWYMQLMLLGQEGRWPDVERMARTEGDTSFVWFHSTYAELLAGAGDPAAVGREALRVLEVDPSRASALAVHLAYLGDLRGASELEPYLPPGSPRVDAYRALVAWRTGDLPGAIAGLRAVAARAPVSIDPAIPPPLYLVGEALAEAGADAEAVEMLHKFQRIPITYPSWFVPRSQWLLARSLDRLGRAEEARRALAPLLALWAHASDGQPHLAEARALGRRLGLR